MAAPDAGGLPVRELAAKALAMRGYSYAPYSRFRVGAALLDADGGVWGGCNIENAAYTPTNCAERTAFFKAVSEGRRRFAAIAVAGGPESGVEGFCAPCGVCRQVMAEFCDPEAFLVITVRAPEDFRVQTLASLLPDGFGPASLGAEPRQ